MQISHPDAGVSGLTSPLPRRSGSRHRGALLAVLLLLAVALPIYARLTGDDYLLLVGARAVVLALAALTLAFLLGNVGLVSFGHATFLGLGAYAVSIPASLGIHNGWIQLALAVLGSGLFAAVTGMVALRTSGVFFIMLTLAFAQMAFYFFSGLRPFGGDDGLAVAVRSRLGPLDLADPQSLYWLCVGVLLLTLVGLQRVSRSHFGRVLLGGKLNEQRLRALGIELLGYRLAAYTAAGALTGLAGFLFANVTGMATPSFMSWQRSGDLLIVVVIGGFGNLTGSILATFAFLSLEGLLPMLFKHWEIAMGGVLVALAFACRTASRRALANLFTRGRT